MDTVPTFVNQKKHLKKLQHAALCGPAAKPTAVALSMARCTVARVLNKGLGCTALLHSQATASFDVANTRDMLAS